MSVHIRVLSQALVESGVAGLIGAERYERSVQRTAVRSGTRPRTWDPRVGTVELAIHHAETVRVIGLAVLDVEIDGHAGVLIRSSGQPDLRRQGEAAWQQGRRGSPRR